MSKTLRNLMARHPDKVAGFYQDPEGGWWLNLKPGWQSGPYTEVHAVHGDTVKEVVSRFAWVVPEDAEAEALPAIETDPKLKAYFAALDRGEKPWEA